MKRLYHIELPDGSYISIDQWDAGAIYLQSYNYISTIGSSMVITIDKIPHIIQALSKVEKLLPLL